MSADRAFRWLPAFAAAGTFLTAAPLVWNGRNIAVFFLAAIYYLPLLFVICFLLIIFAAIVKDRNHRISLICSVLIVVGTPLALLFTDRYLHDYFAFWCWYPTHRELVDRFAGSDGIIMNWDAWGFAGGENDSFLVSDPSDSISTTEAATLWAQRFQPGCAIADVKRMKSGIYMLTTYNCPLQ